MEWDTNDNPFEEVKRPSKINIIYTSYTKLALCTWC